MTIQAEDQTTKIKSTEIKEKKNKLKARESKNMNLVNQLRNSE